MVSTPGWSLYNEPDRSDSGLRDAKDDAMILRTVLVALSALLLAAHFFRWGNLPLVVVSLLIPFLLLIPRRWALLSVQAFTFAGAAVWGHAIYGFVRLRMMLGEPWLRLALILGIVVLVACTAALLLGSESVRNRYPKHPSTSD